MRDLRKPPAPWLFSLLILPLGVCIVGFNFTALPLLLAQAGVPVDRIASVSSIINLPGVIGFLFAPVVDIKFRRRTWLAIAAFGAAISVCLPFPLIGASHLALMTALILVCGLVTSLAFAACGGLIVKTPSESAQSKAAAWIMAGELGGKILILCMIKLDGLGFRKFGMRGLLWTVAAANVLVFAVVAAVFLACGLRLPRVPNSHAVARATLIS